jgi:hypothetical protein
MKDTPERDILIRQWSDSRCELLDAKTEDRLASTASLDEALSIAQKYRGAIWREVLDHRGRPLGPPTLLLQDGPRR